MLLIFIFIHCSMNVLLGSGQKSYYFVQQRDFYIRFVAYFNIICK